MEVASEEVVVAATVEASVEAVVAMEEALEVEVEALAVQVDPVVEASHLEEASEELVLEVDLAEALEEVAAAAVVKATVVAAEVV